MGLSFLAGKIVLPFAAESLFPSEGGCIRQGEGIDTYRERDPGIVFSSRCLMLQTSYDEKDHGEMHIVTAVISNSLVRTMKGDILLHGFQ